MTDPLSSGTDRHQTTDEVTKCSCDRPSVVTMDYDKAINRVCTRCRAHWFGEPGQVKRYTKAEWDKCLAAV